MDSILLRAILAMDSYNRGFAPGLSNFWGSQLGRATASSSVADCTEPLSSDHCSSRIRCSTSVGPRSLVPCGCLSWVPSVFPLAYTRAATG